MFVIKKLALSSWVKMLVKKPLFNFLPLCYLRLEWLDKLLLNHRGAERKNEIFRVTLKGLELGLTHSQKYKHIHLNRNDSAPVRVVRFGSAPQTQNSGG